MIDRYHPAWQWLLRELFHDLRDLLRYGFTPRRAPDDSFDLVDGLHRSLLGALGNSICPQVATEILKACRKLIRP